MIWRREGWIQSFLGTLPDRNLVWHIAEDNCVCFAFEPCEMWHMKKLENDLHGFEELGLMEHTAEPRWEQDPWGIHFWDNDHNESFLLSELHLTEEKTTALPWSSYNNWIV